MTDCFDKTTKHRFGNPDEPSYIKFGAARDKDPKFNIRSGQLKLLGSEVEALFEPSAREIINAIEEQRRAASKTISSVFLVGGFSASDWLFSRLERYLLPHGMQFCRPDSHANKAVADGAIAFYLDHIVSVRVARWTYGTEYLMCYIPSNPQHAARSETIITFPSGRRYIPKAFRAMLEKGTQVSEGKEFTFDLLRETQNIAHLGNINADIQCYRGISRNPEWVDTEPNMFSTLCIVTADTRRMAKLLQRCYTHDRVPYYQLDYKVVLLFGLTELKAQISWMENGKEKRCPAKIVYD